MPAGIVSSTKCSADVSLSRGYLRGTNTCRHPLKSFKLTVPPALLYILFVPLNAKCSSESNTVSFIPFHRHFGSGAQCIGKHNCSKTSAHPPNEACVGIWSKMQYPRTNDSSARGTQLRLLVRSFEKIMICSMEFAFPKLPNFLSIEAPKETLACKSFPCFNFMCSKIRNNFLLCETVPYHLPFHHYKTP